MFGLFRKKKKGWERDAAFYDDLFSSGGHEGQYHIPYIECRYQPVWRRGADIILSMDSPRVLDIGCGPGQFARLLRDNGVTAYQGLDHSVIAVDIARSLVPEWADRFAVGDAFKAGELMADAGIVVLFEVLEHLERDLDLLALIPSGTMVIFSVPSYGSASHVRSFNSARDVEKRYSPIVDIALVEPFRDCPEPGKTIWLVRGFRR